MRKENGQAMLETALVIPILLMILCGIVDFGRILNASIHLNIVTQEAVRKAGLGDKDNVIVQFVNDNIDINNKNTITVNITPNDLQRKSGDYATLKITYEVKYITPLINIILPAPFIVKAQSTIRVE